MDMMLEEGEFWRPRIMGSGVESKLSLGLSQGELSAEQDGVRGAKLSMSFKQENRIMYLVRTTWEER